MAHTLSDQFVTHSSIKSFCDDHVNLPPEKAQEYRDQIKPLCERLKDHISQNEGFALVKMLHSGSVAKGTALKKINDLDVAVYVKKESTPVKDSELIPWIADCLRESNPKMSPGQFIPQDHCIKVDFKGSGLDVDIVPVLYEGHDDDIGFLINKKTGERVLTSIPLHLEFIRKRKKAHPNHYAQVVRLFKWWVELQKDKNNGFRFKSLLVELLVAYLIENKGLDVSDYPLALEQVFNYIGNSQLGEMIYFTDYYDSSKLPARITAQIEVYDPVNPNNNITRNYTGHERQLIVEAAIEAADAIAEATYATTKSRAIERWQVVFGSSFRGE